MTVVFYFIFLLLRQTRAIQLLKGIIILVFIFFIAQKLGLTTISWLLTKVFTFFILACLIIFQPELRKILAQLGKRPFFAPYIIEEEVIDKLASTITSLSQKKIGAIIAIERSTGLRNYIDTGVSVDAEITTDLLNTIFMPTTPLHDGAVIIQKNRIAAASCLLPLSEKTDITRGLGTRHRAAIGLTEETDALVLTISEETGIISMAFEDKLTRNIDESFLKRKLKELLITGKKKG